MHEDLILYVDIQVFKKVIIANGNQNNGDIINLFCFVFHNNISERGEIFMESHLNYAFDELYVVFSIVIQKLKQMNKFRWHFKSLNKKQTKKSKSTTNEFSNRQIVYTIRQITTF
jgi:hypothetical protein